MPQWFWPGLIALIGRSIHSIRKANDHVHQGPHQAPAEVHRLEFSSKMVVQIRGYRDDGRWQPRTQQWAAVPCAFILRELDHQIEAHII
jgi:hypothetical protein